ncbi:type II toxin-antitoxin system VapC family toxin [soil metagenome]
MILVDTNIWIDFFRGNCPELGDLLEENKVACHWIVIGELATGSLSQRAQTLADLRMLDRVKEASPRETLALIENQTLYNKGLSWADVQLLASALIHAVPLWTRDKRLRNEAKKLNASWD